MYIDPTVKPAYSSSTNTGHSARKARMTSPEFPVASEYCVRFWYTMFGTDVGSLKVYAQVNDGMCLISR